MIKSGPQFGRKLRTLRFQQFAACSAQGSPLCFTYNAHAYSSAGASSPPAAASSTSASLRCFSTSWCRLLFALRFARAALSAPLSFKSWPVFACSRLAIAWHREACAQLRQPACPPRLFAPAPRDEQWPPWPQQPEPHTLHDDQGPRPWSFLQAQLAAELRQHHESGRAEQVGREPIEQSTGRMQQ